MLLADGCVAAVAGDRRAFVFAPAVASRTDRHSDNGHWVGTWSASPQAAAAPIQINGQTVRQIVHTSLGGERVRVRLSNAYGTSALVIGSAHVAISAGGASIVGGTDRVLTFNGSPTITIPAGALAVSDPVALDVPDTRRSRRQSLPAGERRRDDPAYGRPANDLHLGVRETSPARAPSRAPRRSPSTS